MIRLSTLCECYALISPQSLVTTAFGAVGVNLYNVVQALLLMPTESELKGIKGVVMTLLLVQLKCTVETKWCQQQEWPGEIGDQSVSVDKDIRFAASVSDLKGLKGLVIKRQ